MLKRTITYTNYNEVEVTEDFYFNLTNAEITEMQLSTDGGYEAMIRKIVDTKNGPALVNIFKDLVLKAYGEKSLDGKRFMKSPEISKAFSETEAYSILFMELATDADAAVKFVNGIIPADTRAKVEKAKLENKN